MRLLVIACLLSLCGCEVQQLKSVPSSNGDYQIHELFTDKDGFTVKRFMDGGTYRYYVTPIGEATHEYVVGDGENQTTVRSSIMTAEKQ